MAQLRPNRYKSSLGQGISTTASTPPFDKLPFLGTRPSYRSMGTSIDSAIGKVRHGITLSWGLILDLLCKELKSKELRLPQEDLHLSDCGHKKLNSHNLPGTVSLLNTYGIKRLSTLARKKVTSKWAPTPMPKQLSARRSSRASLTLGSSSEAMSAKEVGELGQSLYRPDLRKRILFSSTIEDDGLT
ncbi:unnamed protein product [Sphenostylis stenocarpa]|uniref:Uncharacterized protein n=1 Tax=Sphenostylis stenocarpa TaxID=92480 RepID=A0AA86T3V2_9FABA|nr:unnamed protein product [Sphenostylis stenocarpa]